MKPIISTGTTVKKRYSLSMALSLVTLLGMAGITHGADSSVELILNAAPKNEPIEEIKVTSHAVSNTQHAVEELQGRLGAIDSFSAQFVQLTQDNFGNTLQSVEGFMQVAKPGKLIWKTEGIYEQLVVSDGKSIWIYDADLEQVSIKNMDNRLSETPALLLGGDVSAIDDDFIISSEIDESSALYILQPKDTRQLFDSLEVRFNTTSQEGLLTEMVIRDASGQVTQINFHRVENNPELEDSMFTFEIPEGVDVIDGRLATY